MGHHKSCTPQTHLSSAAMQSMMILSALVACTAASLVYPGPVAVRAPSHDSAIIQSHRLGGNFAYSTHEAHAYAVQTPVIGTRTIPVGVSYHHGAPVVRTSQDVITHQIPQHTFTAPQLVAHKQVIPAQQVVPVVQHAAVPQLAAYSANLVQHAAIPQLATYGALPYPYLHNVVAAEP